MLANRDLVAGGNDVNIAMNGGAMAMPGVLGSKTNRPNLKGGTLARQENRPRGVFGTLASAQEEKERACAAFSLNYWHYLPKKFIHHYVFGKGDELVLSEQEMLDCNPRINVFKERYEASYVQTGKYDGEKSKALRKGIDTANGQQLQGPVGLERSTQLMDFCFGRPGSGVLQHAGNTTKLAIDDYGCVAGALTNGTLGNFTAKLRNMTLTVTKTPLGLLDSWRLEGEMSFYDIWDFDAKNNARTSNRPEDAEWKVRFAADHLPGQKFKITSPYVPFWLCSTDDRVQWKANGRTAPEPEMVLDCFAVAKLTAKVVALVMAPGPSLAYFLSRSR